VQVGHLLKFAEDLNLHVKYDFSYYVLFCSWKWYTLLLSWLSTEWRALVPLSAAEIFPFQDQGTNQPQYSDSEQ